MVEGIGVELDRVSEGIDRRADEEPDQGPRERSPAEAPGVDHRRAAEGSGDDEGEDVGIGTVKHRKELYPVPRREDSPVRPAVPQMGLLECIRVRR